MPTILLLLVTGLAVYPSNKSTTTHVFKVRIEWSHGVEKKIKITLSYIWGLAMDSFNRNCQKNNHGAGQGHEGRGHVLRKAGRWAAQSIRGSTFTSLLFPHTYFEVNTAINIVSFDTSGISPSMSVTFLLTQRAQSARRRRPNQASRTGYER